MKDSNDSLPDLVNEDQRLYGLCFNDAQNLYNEMIKINYPQAKQSSSSRTSISNTEILFGKRNSQVSIKDLKELNLDTEENQSLYQRLLISHDSKLKSLFDIIVLIMVNISSLIILYDFCFKETDKKKDFSFFRHSVLLHNRGLFCHFYNFAVFPDISRQSDFINNNRFQKHRIKIY